MSDLRTIATVRKNNSDEIRISVAVHDGYTLVDMRVFSTSRGTNGEPHPTKAGICLSKSTLPDLIRALQAAEQEASR